MVRIVASLFASILLLIPAAPVLAHHGNASTEAKTVVLKAATVTGWLWTNPHTFLKFDVKDETGAVTHWTAEWNAPSTLVNFGFTARTFKVGDQVTVTLNGVAKSGAPIGRLESVLLPDGTLMSEDESVGK